MDQAENSVSGCWLRPAGSIVDAQQLCPAVGIDLKPFAKRHKLERGESLDMKSLSLANRARYRSDIVSFVHEGISRGWQVLLGGFKDLLLPVQGFATKAQLYNTVFAIPRLPRSTKPPTDSTMRGSLRCFQRALWQCHPVLEFSVYKQWRQGGAKSQGGLRPARRDESARGVSTGVLGVMA